MGNIIQQVSVDRINTEIAKIAAPIDISLILRMAIDKDMPIEQLRAAFELHRDMEAIRRQQIFNVAFAEFKRVCPPIIRRTEDTYITVTRNGATRARKYASLHDITSVVDPLLHELGFSYHWSDAVQVENDCIVREFVLTHSSGHSRSTKSPPIPIEGGKAHNELAPNRKKTSASPQQCMGVADTYAMRYSLISGLGLTTCDEDDDGRLPRNAAEVEPINEEQFRRLNDLCIERGGDVLARVLKFGGVEKLADFPVEKFDRAVATIERELKTQTK